MWAFVAKILTSFFGSGEASARLPALIGLAAGLLALLLLGGYSLYGHARMQRLEEHGQSLARENALLREARDNATTALGLCRKQAELEAGLLSKNRQEKDALQSKYNEMRLSLATGLLPQSTRPSAPGHSSARPSGQAASRPENVGGTIQPFTVPDKEFKHETSFQEWCAQPVPDFINGLLTGAAPAALPGPAPADLAARNPAAPK